jgi:hypothetical protein
MKAYIQTEMGNKYFNKNDYIAIKENGEKIALSQKDFNEIYELGVIRMDNLQYKIEEQCGFYFNENNKDYCCYYDKQLKQLCNHKKCPQLNEE